MNGILSIIITKTNNIITIANTVGINIGVNTSHQLIDIIPNTLRNNKTIVVRVSKIPVIEPIIFLVMLCMLSPLI